MASQWITNQLAKLNQLYASLHWGFKLGTALALFVLSIALTAFTEGNWLAVIAEVAFGVVTGVGIWAFSTYINGEALTLQGLANAALDAFLVSSLFVFVTSSVNAIQYWCRSPKLASYELDPRSIKAAKQGDPSFKTFRKRVWQNEAKFNKGHTIKVREAGC